jgi:glycosyltransferase involved in cell wall biosynthesis
VDHHALPALYAMAEALLKPSLYEACPSPPLEAMACGCPVLTSDRHGSKEIAHDAALLVDPESVDAIEGGIRRLIGDQDLRQQLIRRGFERQRTFTWTECAQQTMKILESAGRQECPERHRDPGSAEPGLSDGMAARADSARDRRGSGLGRRWS